MNTLATKTRKCLTTHPQAGLPHQCAETGPDLRGGSNESMRVLRLARPDDGSRGRISPVNTSPASPFNGKRPGNIRFVCTCALDAVGLVVGLLLAFGMVVVLGAVMGAL